MEAYLLTIWEIKPLPTNGQSEKKIMEAREVFLKTNILADEIFKESRRQLERRP